MVHIEKSAFRRGEYTALAGTAETLTRYRIRKAGTGGWEAIGASDPTNRQVHFARTLSDLDTKLQAISR